MIDHLSTAMDWTCQLSGDGGSVYCAAAKCAMGLLTVGVIWSSGPTKIEVDQVSTATTDPMSAARNAGRMVFDPEVDAEKDWHIIREGGEIHLPHGSCATC